MNASIIILLLSFQHTILSIALKALLLFPMFGFPSHCHIKIAKLLAPLSSFQKYLHTFEHLRKHLSKITYVV